MNEEIPYNPPGLDEYIREGAKKNSALLRKMQGQPEPSATAEAKPDCAPRTCSAADVAMEQLKSARDWILKMAREAEKQERILDALNLESIAELIESAEPKLRQNKQIT